MMTAPRASVHSFDWTSADPRSIRRLAPCGGAEETRTPDFLLAKEALYQLSYGPVGGYAASGAAAPSIASVSERSSGADTAPAGEAGLSVAPRELSESGHWGLNSASPSARVGVSGLEPETSALSGQCSNQLS